MRYYFHLVSKAHALLDLDGGEADDVYDAANQAVRVIEVLRAEHPSLSCEWSKWELQVADCSGAVLLAIDLDAIGQ
jgi:hypothetical protein